MIDTQSAQSDEPSSRRHDEPSMTLVRRVEHTSVAAPVMVDAEHFIEETHAAEMFKLEVNVTASKKEAGYTIGYNVPLNDLFVALKLIEEFDKEFFTKTFPGGKSRHAGAS